MARRKLTGQASQGTGVKSDGSKPPEIEVVKECTFDNEHPADKLGELVIQKVTYGKHANGYRLFVRPHESHDEPDARWDEHEPEDRVALDTIFRTYGKGSGTEIHVKHNVNTLGLSEYFLDVRHPKPTTDDDAPYPKIYIFGGNESVADMFAELDPDTKFVSRTEFEEEQTAEVTRLKEELDPIAGVLDEFAMPGDLPAHLYSLEERLRSIFRTAKGLTK